MKEPESPTLSFLLRLWPVERDGHLLWRASLEAPATGERLGFGTLARLFDFLAERCVEEPPGAADDLLPPCPPS